MLNEVIDQLPPEELKELNKRYSIALNIARAAVTSLGVTYLPDNIKKFEEDGARIYYQEFENGLDLCVEINSFVTQTTLRTSIPFAIIQIIADIENLLADDEARILLGVQASSVDSATFDAVLEITKAYITFFPAVIYHSIHQSLDESIANYIKKGLEPNMMAAREKQGLNPKFVILRGKDTDSIRKLFPNANLFVTQFLKGENKVFSNYRKGAYSGRKVFLTPEVSKDLYNHYEELRKIYSSIKKHYIEKMNMFFEKDSSAESSNWEAQWAEFCATVYPLFEFADNDKDRMPSELAYRHLSKQYGYSIKYMEQRVIESRMLAKEKIRRLNRP